KLEHSTCKYKRVNEVNKPCPNVAKPASAGIWFRTFTTSPQLSPGLILLPIWPSRLKRGNCPRGSPSCGPCPSAHPHPESARCLPEADQISPAFLIESQSRPGGRLPLL